jgi:hypothetical protein
MSTSSRYQDLGKAGSATRLEESLQELEDMEMLEKVRTAHALNRIHQLKDKTKEIKAIWTI